MTHVYSKDTLKNGLAVLIREAADSPAMTALFDEYNTVQKILTASEDDFLAIPGIGKAKARQLFTALAFLQMMPQAAEERFTVRSPEDVFHYVSDLQYLPQEHFVCLGLDTKNHVLFRKTIFVGSLNSSIVHPRETFLPLIQKSCAAAVVVHNHPSGDPYPSQEDINVTKRLKEVGEIVGIELLDHVIVGHHQFTSLKEKGWM